MTPGERAQQAADGCDNPVKQMCWMCCERAISAAEKDLHDLVHELQDALIWCSGADDFAPGGKARAGWEKIRHLLR